LALFYFILFYFILFIREYIYLQLGALCHDVVEGRSDIISTLKRRRYHEIPELELQKKKLKKSPLTARYHILDCVGKGLVKRLAMEGMRGRKFILRLPAHP